MEIKANQFLLLQGGMALKACSYRNCQNYVLDHVPSGSFTLFKFPKNDERREKWMELGQAPKNLPHSAYYYCSDHFDRKFMAVNQRRTTLVGEAMPFPCPKFSSSPTRDEATSSNGNGNCNVTNDNDVTSIQTIYVSERGNEDCEPYNEYILCEMKDIGREANQGTEDDNNLVGQQPEDFQVGSTMSEDAVGNLKHNVLYDINLPQELNEDSSNDCVLEQRKVNLNPQQRQRQRQRQLITKCKKNYYIEFLCILYLISLFVYSFIYSNNKEKKSDWQR